MGALPDAQGQAGDREGQIFSALKPALTLAQKLLPSHAHPRAKAEGQRKWERTGVVTSGERRQEKQESPAAGELASPAKSSPNRELLTGKGNNPNTSPAFQLSFCKIICDQNFTKVALFC